MAWGLLVHLPSSPHRPRQPEPQPAAAKAAAAIESRSWWRRLVARLISSPQAVDKESTEIDIDAARVNITPLPMVRLEFAGCLADIPSLQADQLLLRIRRARSLRELWHLRGEVFDTVSEHGMPGLAEARLARLNRHFPAACAAGEPGSAADQPGMEPQ
jgi:hypothetical protein